MRDPYLYPEVNVLRNLKNIKEEEKLRNFESAATYWGLLTIDELLEKNSKINYEYLKQIHKSLFERVYDWAGKERLIDIYKTERVLNGASVDYEKHDKIAMKANSIIDEMDKINWTSLAEGKQAELYSNYIVKLWQVHPFREGNTRTTMTFAAHYAIEHGFSLNRELIAENSQYARDALTIATIGEEYHHHIRDLMKDAIEKGDNTYFKKVIERSGFDATEKLVDDLKNVNRTFGRNVSVKELKHLYCNKENLTIEEKLTIEKAGNDFVEQEKKQIKMERSHNELER